MKMNLLYSMLCTALLLCFFPRISYTQTNSVDFDISVKRSLNGETTLDRDRYFRIHNTSKDSNFLAFFEDYNVNSGGRGFWSPLAVAKQKTGAVGTYPSFTPQSDGQVRAVSDYIATDHPANAYREGIDIDAAAEWAVHYYKNEVGVNGRPRFYEPINEPFVHARDFYDEPDWTASAEIRVKSEMARLYGALGKKIHETPELANMNVIGYSSAYPALERKDFEHWQLNQKLFFDIAGEHMDGFATHLYDGINVVGQDSRRSGSNAEAILDLIETYSFVKWDSIKPHAISEYGAIEKGYPDGYSDVKSIQTVRSINHILFNLLERQDKLLVSIPFITGKAQWHINAANNYQPYGAVLFIPENIGVPLDQVTGWKYTARVHFFELWKKVQGERVLIHSNNPDIQAQAFVDGNKLFLALNNLDDTDQKVALNALQELPEIQEVLIKRLKIYKESDPEMLSYTESAAPASITLVGGETAILEYSFAEATAFTNTIERKQYYTSKHLEAISANTQMTFRFEGVETGQGYAKLNMSIGRKHNRSKTPIVKVNGQTIVVPDNWKGYDQADRDDFFGRIEIPVPATALQEDNTVTITFPDSGGHLSSLILEVEKYEKAVTVGVRNQPAIPLKRIYPNPGRDRVRVDLPEGVTTQKMSVLLTDSTGRRFQPDFTRLNHGLELNVNTLTSGTYFLTIKNGNTVYSGKIEKL